MSSDNEDNNKSCDITDEEFNDTFKTSTINKTDDETSCITKEKEDIEYLQSLHEKRPPWYQHSVVFLNNGRAILMDAKGNYAMPLDFMSYGYWSWSEKIATLLTLDYKND